MSRILLSNYQYAMLQASVDGLTLEQAGQYKQTAFASMISRGYLVFRGSRFRMTRQGRDALATFHGTDVTRKHPSEILARYVQLYLDRES